LPTETFVASDGGFTELQLLVWATAHPVSRLLFAVDEPFAGEAPTRYSLVVRVSEAFSHSLLSLKIPVQFSFQDVWFVFLEDLFQSHLGFSSVPAILARITFPLKTLHQKRRLLNELAMRGTPPKSMQNIFASPITVVMNPERPLQIAYPRLNTMRGCKKRKRKRQGIIDIMGKKLCHAVRRLAALVAVQVAVAVDFVYAVWKLVDDAASWAFAFPIIDRSHFTCTLLFGSLDTLKIQSFLSKVKRRTGNVSA
jgi:hypothetical protein